MATTAVSDRSWPQREGVNAKPVALAIGDTLTVVSGCLGDAWVVEDENGIVYLATAVE